MSALAATWTGYVSDAGCGAKHADASGKSQKCVAACIKGKNASAVLVVDGKVFRIDTIRMAH